MIPCLGPAVCVWCARETRYTETRTALSVRFVQLHGVHEVDAAASRGASRTVPTRRVPLRPVRSATHDGLLAQRTQATQPRRRPAVPVRAVRLHRQVSVIDRPSPLSRCVLIIVIIIRNLYSAIMPLGGCRGAGGTGR